MIGGLYANDEDFSDGAYTMEGGPRRRVGEVPFKPELMCEPLCESTWGNCGTSG
jgi:hypothetical protein